MKRKIITAQSFSIQRVVPSAFSLVSWNLNKKCYHPIWPKLFNQLHETVKPTFLFFQEMDYAEGQSALYTGNGYHVTLAPNLLLHHRGGTPSGVSTLSPIDTNEHTHFFTNRKEPIVRIPKPALVSEYEVEGGMTLLLINIHGINFVHNWHFKAQLEQLRSTVYSHRGPAIIGGDFNSWNVGRIKEIEAFLSLVPEQEYTEVDFGDHTEHLKKAPKFWQHIFGEHHLDRFYYAEKYLEIEDAPRVIRAIKDVPLDISDHSALYMKFRIKAPKDFQ